MSKVITYGLMLPVTAAMIGLAAYGQPPQAEPVMPPGAAAQMRSGGGKSPGDLPSFDKVSKDYKKVVSTADGKSSLYTLWTRDKDGQILAELPRNYEKQLVFMAYTVAGGTPFAGVQSGDRYVKWRRYDKRLALIEPNFAVRTSGDLESKKGLARVFTDRVILDVPIVAMGPGGGPVIDMDALLVGKATKFFGFAAQGANPKLTKIAKAKAFPQNVELAFETPLASGRFATLHYSLKGLPENTGYKPRKADERIGYFTTTYQDIGDPAAESQWVRYINRWKLDKADPKLRMSPPKQPIVFYLEHTLPVRYRRWVRDGVLEWNEAYEKVGIVNAIEVYQQDARTGAHMEKDPEDARYNFVLWTNSNMGFAIGPSRVDPRTGQIMDADIVMDEGFISSWVRAWRNLVPEIAMEGFGPQTLSWLETRPQWDPRVRLAAPEERQDVITRIQQNRLARVGQPYASHPAVHADATLIGDDAYDGLHGRISQMNGMCMNAMAKSMDMALFRLSPDIFAELAMMTDEDDDEDEDGDHDDDDADDEDDDEADDDDKKKKKKKKAEKPSQLDGVPEAFVGPLLKDVVMHEVGHTLGLRHNFKASSIYTLEEINTPEFKGKPQTGSVMDYNPVNVNFKNGPVQGDYTMVTIGPYDYWAIEYGYTDSQDLKPILHRCAEEHLTYATDEDTWGPDPLARRFDYGADPLNYAETQMALVTDFRTKLLDRVVKDGDSWAKSRRGYEILLGRHFGAIGIATNWIGGSYINRDKKGDPGDRDPVVPVEADMQRRALNFVIKNAFEDEAFGLNEELLAKMTVDKWWDDGGFNEIFQDPTWPVHDRISGIQAAALTMIMNPTSLNRVLDLEYRVPSDEDALTVAEVLYTVSDSVWSELDEKPSRNHDSRNPMISSLRRNLQSEHVDRLIDLSLPNPGFGAAGKPISNLSVSYLRQLHDKIGKVQERYNGKLDPYTRAHLSEAGVRIAKALDAQYIYNTDDISSGGGMPMFFFEPTQGNAGR